MSVIIRYDPQPDITLWELARAIPGIVQLETFGEVWEREEIPAEIRRHFKVTEIPTPPRRPWWKP